MTDTSDVTQITSPNRVEDADKTLLSTGSGSATDHGRQLNATMYSSMVQSEHTSAGFAEAQKLARQAQSAEGEGSLLKNRFLLESILGVGGMGTVYKTRDLRKVEAEDPNPYIATKVLNPEFKLHPNAFVTLQQETAKTQTLAHPNIVTVHDFDRDGETLYMTMELLEGEPLDQLIKRYKKGLPHEQAFEIVRHIASALAYAHQRQIIHADFKPGNVFVCNDGTAKVLDFGIARAATKETQRHRFDAGQLGALTPAYATIEMVKDEPLTFSDDVYALGCVVYELFTGLHPYEHLSAKEAQQRGLKLKPIVGLKSKQWRVISRALAFEKHHRTATVLSFIGELFPKRNPVLLISAVVFLAIAVGGISLIAYRQYQETLKVQETIADNMTQAQTCFAGSDFACAADRSRVVVNLDPSNSAAAQLLAAAQMAQQKQEQKQKVIELLDEGNACLQTQDDACAQIKARDLLVIEPNNVQAQQLLAAANALEQNHTVIDNLQQAEACLQNKDITCATLFAKKAAEIAPNMPAVNALNEKLHNLEQQGKAAVQIQLQKIAGLVQQAQECLAQKKYECAMKQAEAALELDAANGLAMEVKQTAAVADKQNRDAQEKVNKILAQAKDCLEKQKNYACAIAKAEAALDVMPASTEAAVIKAKAQETQRKIKETGFTIK